MKQEILFTEPAKHYLLSSDHPNETVLVTVSPSEVNVMLKFSAANTPAESALVATATSLSPNDCNIIVKQANRADEFNGEVTHQELAVAFLTRLQSHLATVSEKREAAGEENSFALNTVQQGVVGLLNQAEQ